ncbi:hypothetical protein GCM10008927_12270 [Amylibacter ulvae]|uniref:Uncharacterized protein n=1 Tax=Paramylibacter ulvae TaxID=1651968 RepID=A0ABQ3CZI5_9RHOB|nr:hypothetical protein [Amylibacter ulvae]GHA48691.1 hypothetical protein GCM10008927_12270 [Amylibacter ulvae]
MLKKNNNQEKLATKVNSTVHCCECNKELPTEDQAGVENEYCADCQRKFQAIIDLQTECKAAS